MEVFHLEPGVRKEAWEVLRLEEQVELEASTILVLLSTAVTESVASKILVLTVVVALHHHFQLYVFLVVHWVVLVVLEVWEDLLGARVAWTIHQVVLVVLVVLAVLV